MSSTTNVARSLWDDPTFKDAPFTEREALMWLMAHGRIIRTTVRDLGRVWLSSPRRVAHILRRLERLGCIGVHGSGPSRAIFVHDRFGAPCGFYETSNGQQETGPGAGLWRGDPLPAATRAAVLERDEATCRYCGSTAGPFDIDHIRPVALGGTDALENLTVACVACNRSKGAKPLAKWKGRK